MRGEPITCHGAILEVNTWKLDQRNWWGKEIHANPKRGVQKEWIEETWVLGEEKVAKEGI